MIIRHKSGPNPHQNFTLKIWSQYSERCAAFCAMMERSGSKSVTATQGMEALAVMVPPLSMGHILDKSKGGDDSQNNLRALCANCNEGLQNTTLPRPDRIHLLSQIRRATINDQKAVLDWLLQKFDLTLDETDRPEKMTG